ncbi:hypothetical protein PCANC_16163 [Puccinia coronata f. sp. avenae]|uniref:Uncharacterized protein n=1 Tax=Puccinia coronata f. sp. avenae TaxID=200324 RepID=A0A2N5T0X6_9BASI|nr:hypothetical protein PCANC_16163 [Puccinia coronata f. sp. avenae]
MEVWTPRWTVIVVLTPPRPARWPGTVTSSASRSTGLPSWYLYKPNKQFDLLARADTCTSPASRSTSSSGWYFYQASEQVRLLADPEPLQHTSGGARTAGSERAYGLTCPLTWYSYQPGGEVHRLAELVPVPAQQEGHCPLGWYSYQLRVQRAHTSRAPLEV